MKSEIAAGVEVGMIRGSARVRSADGSERPLAVGDRLGEGDELIVPEGSEVLLLGGGHGQLLIDAGDYRLTEEALAPGGGLDGAVQSGDVERVLEALEEGRDPFEDIEAPAAGAAGTEGGHSFVRLLRIAEEITPVGYEFPANGQGPIRAPEEAGAAEAEPGEEPPEDDAPSVSAGSVSVDETGGLDAAYGALAAAFGEDLPGTVELSAEGAVWDGEAQELRDEGGAWVIRLVEGGYEFEQLLPMAHPDGEDPNDAIEIAVTATATDSDGSQASAQFSVRVYDDGPQATGESAWTPEDEPIEVDALANDASGLDSPIRLDSAELLTPGAGSIAYGPEGVIRFEPAPGFEGTAQILYEVADADGDEATAVLEIEVGPDSAPTVRWLGAEGDEGVAMESALPEGSGGGSAIVSGEIDLDTGADGLAQLLVSGVDVTQGGQVPGKYGVLTITVDGGAYAWSYELAERAPHSGEDAIGMADLYPEETFGIVAIDSDGSRSAEDSLSLLIADDGPVALGESAQTPEDTPIEVDVLANDRSGADEPAELAAAQLLTAGAGSVGVLEGGVIRFEPAPGFEGTALIRYEIVDAEGDSAWAALEIVVGEDSEPEIAAGSVSVDETGGLDAAYGALAAAFGEDLPGTVELSAEGAVWDGEAQELRDEGGAWVIRLVEGGYEFEQLLPMAHPDGEDPNDAIEIAVTATATDSDGSQASAQFSVWVYDDGPSLNPPDAALANEAGNRVEGDLGFDPGADGEGAFVRFSAPAGSVDASGYILADWSLGDQGGTARLTMGGEPLRWEEQEDGSLLAVTGEGDAALRVSSDGSVWSVEILGDIDQALIWSTFLTENIQGGNGDFYLVAGEMAGDLLSESIEMRASAVSGGEADTVNTRADYFGVGTGQDISGSQGDELLLEFAQAGSWDPDSGEPTADYEAAEALALSFETSGLGDGESLLWRATLSDGSVAEGRIDGAGNPNSAANKAVWTIGSEDLGGLGLVSIEFSAEGDSSYDIGSFAARAEEGSADQTIRIAAQGFDGDGDATVAAGIEIYLAGDGQIEGTSGADLLSGGSGSDALWGQAGADVFEWTLSDASGAAASEDVVKDFSIAQGDSLKIGDLLPDLGEAWTGEALSAYVSIVEEGGSSSLMIRPEGAAGEVEQVISLEGISLLAGFDTQADALQHMLDQGSLRTD